MSNRIKIAAVVVCMSAIIFLEVLTNRCTEKLVSRTEADLKELRYALTEENLEKANEKSKKLNNNWNESENMLSFYIEHDEIEKISSQIAIIDENTNNEEYKMALEDNIETVYLLEHIKDKLKLKLKNVF